MPRKRIIIIISAFVVVALLVYGLFFYRKSGTGANGTGNGLPLYQQFNPFGTSNPPAGNGAITDPTTGQPIDDTGASGQQGVSNSKFRQITDFPVAGAAFFIDTRPIQPTTTNKDQAATATAQMPTSAPTNTIPTTPIKTTTLAKTTNKPAVATVENVPALRYVNRVTGHITEQYLDTKATGEVSNSTIPEIYEAFFDSRASTVIYRYLSSDETTITSFMATLGGAQGEFLPSNILDISLSPDKTKFFYLVKTPSGVTGTLRTFGDTKKTQVFSSPFTEWLSQWVGGQKIYLTTKASYSVDGDLFSLTTSTGTLSKILGPVQGLTTLANSTGSSVLYSTAMSDGPRLSALVVAGHTITNLNTYTLPEKCVWAHDDVTVYCAVPNTIDGDQYPDVWYQGLVSFTDSFVRINTATSETSVIANSALETPIDGTHLFLSDTEDQLFFINKKDSTLWSLMLK